MKPEHFIREFGVDKARQVVEGAPDWATHFDLTHKDHYQVEDGEECCLEDLDTVDLSDLKRLVESVDLVDSLGGLKAARSEAHKDCFVYSQPLLAAIAAYESIYGGNYE